MRRSEQEEAGVNPKVKIIIDEYFPRIIDIHIRTRSSVESTRQSLERYRAMGLQAVRNLSAEEQQQNSEALESAFAAAMTRLDEFHSRETSPRSPVLPDTTETR